MATPTTRLTLSPVDLLIAATETALNPSPVLDHPVEQCEYCDSPWVHELNVVGRIQVQRVCESCLAKVACEYCAERVATITIEGRDDSTGYSESMRVCGFCARELGRTH